MAKPYSMDLGEGFWQRLMAGCPAMRRAVPGKSVPSTQGTPAPEPGSALQSM